MVEQETRFFSLKEVLRILNIPRHRLDYLFDSRYLKSEDFLTLGNRQRLYRPSDIERIKEVLFQIQSKG